MVSSFIFFVLCCLNFSSPLCIRIHPPDVIGKYAPDSVIGMIGGGGGGAVVAGGAPAAGGAPGIPMTEVAKHNSKTDCWVVVDGQVLDVTSFLSEHPGGELAILTFAGKDATEEFNMTLGVEFELYTFCTKVG